MFSCSEIVVEHQDDVSTLGDPMFGAGGMLIPGLEKDETVAARYVCEVSLFRSPFPLFLTNTDLPFR